MSFRLLTVLLCAIFAGLPAEAQKTKPTGRNSRIMRFSQTAINFTKRGLAEDQNSSCVIVISNPSGEAQLVFLRPNATSTGIRSGEAACSVESGPSPLDHFGATMNPGDAPLVVRCTYPQFPKKKTGQQVILCGGEIEARDTNSSPGMIMASGSLEAFIETERAYKNTDKDGNLTGEGIGTFPVVSTIQISINNGRPF